MEYSELPNNLSKMTDAEYIAAFNYLFEKPYAELLLLREIVEKQRKIVFKLKNYSANKNLNIFDKMLISAIKYKMLLV